MRTNSILIFPFLAFCLNFINSKLIMVLEAYRHGAREPLSDYYNADEFKHWGELTAVGMRQHYNLGKFLRRIYIEKLKFLTTDYDPNEIYVRSTDYNRTIQSAISQLYGLYPLGSGPMIPLNLDPIYENPPFNKNFLQKKHHKNGLPKGFQPVPVHSFPKYEDRVLLPSENNCSIIDFYEEKAKNYSYYQNLTKRFKNVSSEIGKLINLTDEEIETLTIHDLNKIYDVLICDLYDDKPLPQNLTDTLWKNLTLISNIYKLYKVSADDDMLKFYVTPFYQEILYSFENKINGTLGDLKWKMYSAHDTTLAVFMTALNISSYQCIDEIALKGNTSSLNCFPAPEFASNLLIELHQNKKGTKYVKIRYNGGYVNLCEKKKKKCEWSEFEERLRRFMVNYDNICNSQQTNIAVSFLSTKHHIRKGKL